MDIPFGHKSHTRDTPLIGGLGIYLACVSVYLLGFMLADLHLQSPALLLIGAMIVAVGALDDLRGLGVGIRFGVQIIAGVVAAMYADIVIHDLGHLFSSELRGLGWMAVPFTAFAVVGGINAMNMADGLDGLAGSLAAVTFSLLAVVAYMAGRNEVMLQLLVLVAAIGGFLVFNLRLFGRKAASVFMGDAGSMFLGFAIAWYLITLAHDANRSMTPVTALWVFAYPIMDTVSVMIRRVILGRSPFSPDHEHLHYILLHAGLSVNQTVLVLTLMHAFMGGLGMVALYQGLAEHMMFYAYMSIFAIHFVVTLNASRVLMWLDRRGRGE